MELETTIKRPADPGVKKRITFLWKPGKVIAELIYDRGKDKLRFLQRAPDGRMSETPTVNFHTPVEWITGFVRKRAIWLPNAANEYGSIDQLVQRVKSHIHAYFECDRVFESVATLFVMHTWLYERFQAVPYLRFIGMPQTGKSRASVTIGSLCYHAHVIQDRLLLPRCLGLLRQSAARH